MGNTTAHKKYIKYSPYVLIFAVGITLGGLLGYFGRKFLTLELKPEVSLDELFNFIVGVLVAVILQSIWQKNYGATRVEKNLFLELLGSLQNRIDASFELFNKIYIEEKIDNLNRTRPEVREQFNLLVMDIAAAKYMTVNLKNSLQILPQNFGTLIRDFELNLIVYKNNLTLKEYDEVYDMHDFNKAQENFYKLKGQLFDLMVAVNSH